LSQNGASAPSNDAWIGSVEEIPSTDSSGDDDKKRFKLNVELNKNLFAVPRDLAPEAPLACLEDVDIDVDDLYRSRKGTTTLGSNTDATKKSSDDVRFCFDDISIEEGESTNHTSSTSAWRIQWQRHTPHMIVVSITTFTILAGCVGISVVGKSLGPVGCLESNLVVCGVLTMVFDLLLSSIVHPLIAIFSLWWFARGEGRWNLGLHPYNGEPHNFLDECSPWGTFGELSVQKESSLAVFLPTDPFECPSSSNYDAQQQVSSYSK
jgi:hypothetical protein